MEILINLIQGIGIVFFDIICCKNFFSSFFEKRKDFIIWQKISLPLLSILVYGGALVFSNNILLKACYTFIIVSIIMFSYFKVKLIVGIIFTSIFEGLIYGIDYLVLLLFSEITMSTYSEHILTIFVSKMLLFACVLFINKKWGIKNFFDVLSDSEWLRFLYFPFSTIIIFVITLINIKGIEDEKLQDVIIVIAFFLIGMNILLLRLIGDIVEREQKLNETALFDERAENQKEVYKLISDNYYKERKKTHEYKNHMSCIAGMLKNGEIKEVEEYVSGITGELKRDPNLIDTNNIAVNIVLNTKYQEAVNKNIMVILQVNDLSNIKIRNEDIVVIFTNMLNNAIEACEKLKSNKKIWIKFVDEDKMTVISIKNTCEQRLLNKMLRTTKSDKIEHGFGIENIRELTNKYGGSDYIKQESGRFIFTIIFPHD